MKFALANGQRLEAKPDLSGECPSCGKPMVAKCGEVRVWHWAHKGTRCCDPWWESETAWHRAWKDEFPIEWQEIVHHAPDGERHIADVKTHDGWVLEFQHSSIKPDERSSREEFYEGLIWVVDGARRARDSAQFERAWESGKSNVPFDPKRRIESPSSSLLRDWKGGRAHVFFDFGDPQRLWWLFPQSDEKRAYIQWIFRARFIQMHRERCTHAPSDFDQYVQNFSAFIAQFEAPIRVSQPRKLKAINLHVNPRQMTRQRQRL